MTRNSSWTKRSIWVVVILGGVLLVIPQMVPPRMHSCSNACIANLKQIQGAVEQWALENKLTATNHVSLKTIGGGSDKYIKQAINTELKCPAGGTYSVTTVGEEPRCSVAGHTL